MFRTKLVIATATAVSVFITFIGCEGPEGPRGPAGPLGALPVYVVGQIGLGCYYGGSG